MVNWNKVYKIYACIKIVNGQYRGVIIDFNRLEYYFIPIKLSRSLKLNEGNTLSSLRKDLGHHEYDQVIQGLFEEEIIYYKDDFDIGVFPSISEDFNELPIQHLEVDVDTLVSNLDRLLEFSVYGCESISVFIEGS